MGFIENLTERVNNIDWEKYRGPEYYNPSKVVPALINLFSCMEVYPAYNKVLSAIGNNHGGTYYPAAGKAVEFIAEFAMNSMDEIPFTAAVEIMIELYGFEPECSGNISAEELQAEVRGAIKEIAPKLRLNDSVQELRCYIEDFEAE